MFSIFSFDTNKFNPIQAYIRIFLLILPAFHLFTLKRVKPQTTTTMREPIPDDVVEDILARLPVKSLTRFRCVSKSCNSIITYTTFINKHLKLNHNQSESSISANTHSGYLLYTTEDKDGSSSSKELCTVVCNNDRTLTQVSRFEIP